MAATASFDYCHMTSPVDMAAITELDLRGKSGYGLKLGDFAGLPNLEILNMSGYSLSGHSWNQLPVGLFDGLDNLEVLDLSDTNLLNLNRGIFGGLDTLRELDVRPHQAARRRARAPDQPRDVERPGLHPVNLRATIVDFTSDDSSRKKVTPRRGKPRMG